MIYAENKHGRYAIPEGVRHRRCPQTIIRGDVWEPKTINYILKHAGDFGVVHAGAFFGDFLPALREVSQVWAFEPIVRNYNAARETIDMNLLDNVKLTNAALSSTTGFARMQTEEDGRMLGGGSRIVHPNIRVEKEESVVTMRLDDWLRDSAKVGVIHLDVEGHEQSAIAGARHTIERDRPKIITENSPKDLLKSMGYVVDTHLDLRNTAWKFRGSK